VYSSQSPPENIDLSTKRAKILIVDDLPENLHAMKVTLAPLEVEMYTARSGNEALEMMLKYEFAVVLMDVQMPHMDGFEAASLMQNNKVTRGVPIIFVTALSKENEHVFKGYEAGAVDYLFKPVNPDILLSKVNVFIKLYHTRIECEMMRDEIQKSRNLESLGLLAGGIAHDFNNILAAILGNGELAQLKVRQEDQQIQELLRNVAKASHRAKDLTYQLLTFSKGGDPVKSVASIGLIAQDSAKFILHGSNVKCVFDLEKDLLPANIDTGQVGQVVQNIILNAIQAMPEGGIIEMNCNNFVKDDSVVMPIKDGNYIEIKIKDSGKGIPADHLEKIFDPYMTTKKKGNGLGLSITNSIVKKHGGHIRVESTLGVGTTFFIYFPASVNVYSTELLEIHS
jgi:signal transduction histidine kinase